MKIMLRASHSGNRYSQYGEENIIRAALPVLDNFMPGGVLVEFGASTGSLNSNLFAFGEEGRSLVLIESDPQLFPSLVESVDKLPNVFPVLAKVGYAEQTQQTPSRTLGNILDDQNIDTSKVSIVSIDIDSDDAAVFENLGVDPLLVLVEYNNTFPGDARIRNPENKAWGNSSLEIFEVARGRNMFLVAATNTNLVFADNSLISFFEELGLSEAMEPLHHSRLGLAYDGTLVRFTTDGTNTTREFYQGWGPSFLRQPLPKFMRSYPMKYRMLSWTYLAIIGFLSNPLSFLQFLLGAVRYLRSKVYRGN